MDLDADLIQNCVNFFYVNIQHKKYLLKAHSLAYKNFGKTFPNPSIGCLIVQKGKIISKGVTYKTKFSTKAGAERKCIVMKEFMRRRQR